VLGFEIRSGKQVTNLRGHLDSVNCCTFHTSQQELYSGANDRQILVYAPPILHDAEQGVQDDRDTWSD